MAFLDNTQRLCVNTHQFTEWRLFKVILLRNGFPKKTFLKMPMRASVRLRLVCKDKKIGSFNLSCNWFGDFGLVALYIFFEFKNSSLAAEAKARSVLVEPILP